MAAAIMIVALTATGAVTFALSFEPTARYFQSSPVVITLYIAIGITVVFALSAFFILKGLTVTPASKPTNHITAALSAVSAAVPFIYYIYSDVSARIAASQAPQGTLDASYGGLETIPTLILVFAAISLISSLYLVIRDSKIAALIACYARVIFLALIITNLYLDFSVELNSPVKLLAQFAAVAAMLASTASVRPIVGKPKAASFVLSQYLCAALCLLCFALLATEIAPHSEKYTTDLIVFPIMLLVLGIESAVHLFACRVPPHIAEIEATDEVATVTDTTEQEADNDNTQASEPEADKLTASEPEADESEPFTDTELNETDDK